MLNSFRNIMSSNQSQESVYQNQQSFIDTQNPDDFEEE